MSQELDSDTAASIESQVPNVYEIRKEALGFEPNILSMAFPRVSVIPIAAVCLHDSTSTLQAVRYALIEALAHLHHYRKRVDPPDEHGAGFFGRFYADDAALRLYAASEHLAEAVIAMLEITSDDLKPFSKKGIADGSRQRLVGKFLIRTKANHPISGGVQKLIDTKEWLATINYRNQWVHSKPPIVKGLGIEYERKNRLEIRDGSIGISVGGGDQASYDIDDLIEMVRRASFAFLDLTTLIVRWYGAFVNEKLPIRL